MAFGIRGAAGLLGSMTQQDDQEQGLGLLPGMFGRKKPPYGTPPFMPESDVRLPQSEAGTDTSMPTKPTSFWNGGDKFTLRDGAAGALAAIGDGLARDEGIQPTGLAGLSNRRLTALGNAPRLSTGQVSSAQIPPSGHAPALDGPWSAFDPSAEGASPSYSPPDPRDAPRLPGSEPREKKLSYWQGGDKMGTWDAIAGVAAVLGDALAPQSGMGGGSVAMLSKGRQAQLASIAAAQKAEKIAGAMRKLGYSDDEVTLAMTDTDSIGSNFNTRLGTRVVAPGSSIVTGSANGQQVTHSQPNGWDAYAAAQGLRPGTPGYKQALQDYVLRGNGPTAFDYDTQLDDHRTGNDLRLEGQRQGNRMRVRQTPTYRDTHAPPPRIGAPAGRAGAANAPRMPKVAEGPNGQKLYLRNGRWEDAQGRPIQ